MKTWVDGALVDDADAVVSAFDHGLTVGDGVFETVKVLDAVPFALRRHLDRLARSAAGLGLQTPDLAQVGDACSRVVAQAPVGRHRLRITYTGGLSPLGSGRGDAKPTLVIALAPMDPWPESTKVAVVPWPRNERGALAGLKTTSYAENVVALAYAKRLGAGEALFADTRGAAVRGHGQQRVRCPGRSFGHARADHWLPGRSNEGTGPRGGLRPPRPNCPSRFLSRRTRCSSRRRPGTSRRCRRWLGRMESAPWARRPAPSRAKSRPHSPGVVKRTPTPDPCRQLAAARRRSR